MRGCFGHRRDAAPPPAPSILQVVVVFPGRGGKQPLPQRTSTRVRQSRRGKAGKSNAAAVPRRPLCPSLPPMRTATAGFACGDRRAPYPTGCGGEVAMTRRSWHRCGKPSVCRGTGTFPKTYREMLHLLSSP